MTLPAGFEERRIGAVALVAQRAIAGELANVLAEHGSLYEWASMAPQPVAMRGRAPVYVATLPRSEERVVVRHAWHGGVLAPLTRDLFRTPPRAERELEISAALRERGIPTTELLAYTRHPALPGFVRVDVASRLVPDAHDLGAVLSGHAPSWDAARAAAHTSRLLEQLAAERLHHPDLNVKNVLLAPLAGDSALVIDVDVVERKRTSDAAHVANVARLLRSITKWVTRNGDADPSLRARARVLVDALSAGRTSVAA